MKVRIKSNEVETAFRDAVNRINAAHPDGLPNMGLKRQVSIEAIISFHLDAEPDTIRGESRWCCPFHHDTNPSLWARDDHKDSGIGRWGCNPCGISGDVFDFLERLHNYTKAEAIRCVKVWHKSHRGIRVRLRRREVKS
jgi:hypothetical protein